MHPGVKRKRSSSQDYSTHFERQQKSLFDLSVIKLQQEQVRNGVEPRLLRFVLINNALRALQAHMVRLADDDALGPLDYDGMSNKFLSNTFKETGHISCPFSATTPTKIVKLEMPLSEGHMMEVSSTFCEEVDVKQQNGEQRQAKEKKVPENQNRVFNGSLGKRSSEVYHKNDSEDCPSRKVCRPYVLHMNGTTIATGSSLSSDMENSNGNPVSPIDFTKVDPSLYDFDDPVEGLRNISSSAISGLANCNTPFSNSSEFYTTRTVNGIATPVSHSTDLPATSDLLDEIEQIVSLLMP